MKSQNNDVLVAIMNNKNDFRIARQENWYRIPVQSAPRIVRQNKIKLLSFYHTKVFDKEKFSIRWFAEVKDMKIVKRKNLFPDLHQDPKAEKEYYKIEFNGLNPLTIPIISLRHRRILFVPTTQEKFFSAKEINFLFNESPLEEKLWETLLLKNIPAERQFDVSAKESNFYLDFAIFCKDKKINVECDGDKYHLNKKEDIKKDKERNNVLESLGWSVLRFSTSDILEKMNQTYKLLSHTINYYGGVEDINISGTYRYVPDESNKL